MKLFPIHSSVKACALVASLLTLLTASGHADNHSGNGGSGSDSGRLAVRSITPEEGLLIAGRADAAGDLPLLLSSDGQGGLLKDGKPFRAIGVNYFYCFYRTLLDGGDTSYEQGFEVLAREGIPFVRFAATGFWSKDMALYRIDQDEYFRRLDAVVASAEKHGIGLIPSLFW